MHVLGSVCLLSEQHPGSSLRGCNIEYGAGTEGYFGCASCTQGVGAGLRCERLRKEVALDESVLSGSFMRGIWVMKSS